MKNLDLVDEHSTEIAMDLVDHYFLNGDRYTYLAALNASISGGGDIAWVRRSVIGEVAVLVQTLRQFEIQPSEIFDSLGSLESFSVNVPFSEEIASVAAEVFFSQGVVLDEVFDIRVSKWIWAFVNGDLDGEQDGRFEIGDQRLMKFRVLSLFHEICREFKGHSLVDPKLMLVGMIDACAKDVIDRTRNDCLEGLNPDLAFLNKLEEIVDALRHQREHRSAKVRKVALKFMQAFDRKGWEIIRDVF